MTFRCSWGSCNETVNVIPRNVLMFSFSAVDQPSHTQPVGFVELHGSLIDKPSFMRSAWQRWRAETHDLVWAAFSEWFTSVLHRSSSYPQEHWNIPEVSWNQPLLTDTGGGNSAVLKCWHHVCGTEDGEASAWAFWWCGVLVAGTLVQFRFSKITTTTFTD